MVGVVVTLRSIWTCWSTTTLVVTGDILDWSEQLKDIPRGPSLPTSRNRSRKSQNLTMEPWVQEIWSSRIVGMVQEAWRKAPEVQYSQGRVPRIGINQATRASSGRENVKFGTMKMGSVLQNGFPLGDDDEERRGEGYTWGYGMDKLNFLKSKIYHTPWE